METITPDQKIVADALGVEENVSVKSGNGPGKSCLAACAALWFLYSYVPSIVITTAPTERQVKEVLWREIRHRKARAYQKLPGKPLIMKLDLAPRHYALGVSTNEMQQMQGFHCDNIMLIIDEANAYPDDMYEAILGLASGGIRKLIFRIGNPINPIGHFFDSFSDGKTWTHTMSCLNHPNVVTGTNIIPGAVTKEWVDRMRKLWGEDSAFWQSRVLGNFPRVATDLVVNLNWFEAAEQIPMPKIAADAELYMGYDPAAYGNDEHVWYIGTSNAKIDIHTRKHIEPREGADITIRLYKQYNIPGKNVTIDGIGVGAAIYSFLKDDIPGIRRFVASETAKDAKTFEDKQAEAYWNIRCMLNPAADGYSNYSFGSKCDRLKSDVCSRKYSSPKGRIMLEPKPKFRDRLKRSPNWGDGFMLCYSPLVGTGAFSFTILPDVIGA